MVLLPPVVVTINNFQIIVITVPPDVFASISINPEHKNSNHFIFLESGTGKFKSNSYKAIALFFK